MWIAKNTKLLRKARQNGADQFGSVSSVMKLPMPMKDCRPVSSAV